MILYQNEKLAIIDNCDNGVFIMNKMSVPRAVVVCTAFLIFSILFSVFVFGGVPVGPILEYEKPLIEAWISWNNLNYIGDYCDTIYGGEKPSYDTTEGKYNYIRSNHRDRPWLKIDKNWLSNLSDFEKPRLNLWILINNFNEFGDHIDTLYIGGTPLFNEQTGTEVSYDEYILTKFPERPWNDEKYYSSPSKPEEIKNE